MASKTARAPAAQNGRGNPLQITAAADDPDARIAQDADADADERAIAEVQGIAEGVAVGTETVTFMGEEFRIAETIGLMPLLKFASASDRGMASEDMAGMAAMYAMIRDCIDQGRPCTCGVPEGEMHKKATADAPGCEWDPGDWPRFEDRAIATKAGGDDLFQVVTDVLAKVSARPTRPPSGSSPTEPPPSPRSRGSSPSQAEGLVSVDDLLR